MRSGGALRRRQVVEQVGVEAERQRDLADHPVALLFRPPDRVELRTVSVLEQLRFGDVREQVEPDAVGLEPVLPLQQRADDLAAREVAEITRVVVSNESTGPGSTDLPDPR